MESSPGESSPEASPALLERAVFRAGSHDDSQRDSPRMRSSVQGHDAQQRQMHMQADAPQVSCRTPVGTAADSDLLSHDDESPPLRLDLFSHAVKPLPEVAGMGELPQVANTCEHGVDAGGAPACSMFTPAATGRQRIADPSSAGNDSPPLELSLFTAKGHKFCEPDASTNEGKEPTWTARNGSEQDFCEGGEEASMVKEGNEANATSNAKRKRNCDYKLERRSVQLHRVPCCHPRALCP